MVVCENTKKCRGRMSRAVQGMVSGDHVGTKGGYLGIAGVTWG